MDRSCRCRIPFRRMQNYYHAANYLNFSIGFNCEQFLLLQPCLNAFGVVLTQAQSHLLLSSLITALNNIQRYGRLKKILKFLLTDLDRADLPVFVPVREEMAMMNI